MKKIRIDKIVEPHPNPFYVRDTFYWVYLGNSTSQQFNSKREALAHLAKVNRFLNHKLHESNYLYSEVFCQYRENWFYFWHNKKTYDGNLFADQRKIEKHLEDAKTAFEMIVNRSHLTNGNYFVWLHFNIIFNSMFEICQILEALQKSRSNGAEAERIRILSDRITICRNQINGYGKTTDLINKLDENGRVIELKVKLINSDQEAQAV